MHNIFFQFLIKTNAIFAKHSQKKMSSLKIIQTADGSHTLYSEQHHAYYHSTNGALQESLHVFIKCGFDYLTLDEINILEVGFGTGLNAALTASSAINKKQKTKYTGIDLYPPDEDTLLRLNYKSVLNKEDAEAWKNIISIKWGAENRINDFFLLKKIKADFADLNLTDNFHLIYFDAFAPDDQPEMWTLKVFEKLYQATASNGVLVTYCSKGIVKQALREAGYIVERLSGPPGKRHIIRAIKR